LAESIAKASGWTIVYQHSYIDENGKYHCRMQGRNDFMLNMSDKLREERQKNSEKLIEKSKEKATEKREKLQEALEENKTETEDKKTDGEQEKSVITIVKENAPLEKVEHVLLEKLENSDNGEIYLDDDDMQLFIPASNEPSSHACMDIWRLPRGSNTPFLAAGFLIDAAKEDTQGKVGRKNQIVAGGNLDMKI